MVKITKNNYRKFSLRSLLPKSDGSRPSGQRAERQFQMNIDLLDKFRRDYNSLQAVRDNRERCKRYLYGDQLSDTIPSPDGCGKITEKEYIRKQGMNPMWMNIIAEPINNIVGLYVRNHMEPLVVSRDRDEQKLGEMMTIAMEYVYENQHLPRINARGYEEFLTAAIVAFRTGWDRDDERNASDVKVSLCDINRMAWDENCTGMYFENISRIGYLHDMTLGEVLRRFAKSPSEREAIQNFYEQFRHSNNTNQQFQSDTRKTNISFYDTINPENCRVYEIWTREMLEGEEDGWLFHDIAKGEEILTSDRNDPSIIEENNRRLQEVIAAGGSPDDAALIEFVEYRCTEKWVVRYLTPNGYVLEQKVSPYTHGSHPFVIGAYPLMDGEIHSLVERLINIQRVFNSTFTRNNFIRMNQAKGAGAANKKVLERSGVTKEEFAAAYTDPSAILELDWEPGEEIFKVFTDSTHSTVDDRTMQQCLELMDKLSGNSGAIRGEAPKSGTPSSLYAQQVENSNNNIADLVEWYNGLIAKRDYKVMMIIQQFYKDKRYLNIAGRNYSEESKWYDPEKVRNSMFDLSLVESQTQGIFRAQNENLLIMLLEQNKIGLDTYLEMSTATFADKMLENIKSKQQDMQNGMQPQGIPVDGAMTQGMPAQQPMQQPMQPQMM